jgi:hypothetical protein
MTSAEDRPIDPTPIHTADLPPTPTRDRNIPTSAWLEAPPSLTELGADLGLAEALYKRRIGRWLLWRAGPARGAAARYLAVDADDLGRSFTFTLDPEGTGNGEGPSGTTHARFRTWKEDLRDHG